MLIAFVADIHARGKDLRLGRAQMDALYTECVNRRVSAIGIAGDVFDRPQIGDENASTGAIIDSTQALANLALKIRVYMIPGNHDQSGVGSADALHAFDSVSGVRVCHEPAVLSTRDEIDFVCVPWSWAGDNAEQVIWDMVEQCRPAAKKILLAHVRVTGARMGGSFTCDAKPGAWQVSRGFLESLDVDHIALGDFHARQELVPGKGGYVGALRQLNYGEEGNPAGFEIWNSETNETEWVELHYAPEYRTVMYDSRNPSPVVSVKGERLKVQIVGDVDHAEVRKMESIGIQVEHIIEREERVARAEVPPGILDDPHGLIDLWAGQQEPTLEPARRERMLAVYDKVFADMIAPSAQATDTIEALGIVTEGSNDA